MATVQRIKLYEQVWTIPTVQLAAMYGLSDVGLAKVCKRYAIPRPPRGHWAKLQAGQTVTRPKLPRMQDPSHELVDLKGWDLPEGPTIAELKPSVQPKPNAPTQPHPLEQRVLELLRAVSPGSDGLVRPDFAQCPHIVVSRGAIERAAHVFGVLCSMWEATGGTVRIGQKRSYDQFGTLIGMEQDGFWIELTEELDDSKPITDPAHFTGRLTLTLHGHEQQQLRRRWSDTKSQRLENLFKLAVLAMQPAVKVIRQIRLDAECRGRQRAAVQKLRREAAVAHERLVRDHAYLMQDVNRWHEAQRIRAFLQAMTNAINTGNAIVRDEEAHRKWMDWALDQADIVDPLVGRRRRQPDEGPKEPANIPIEQIELTAFTHDILITLKVSDTDQLAQLSLDKLRTVVERGAQSVWVEIGDVLEARGYDVRSREEAKAWY